MTGLDPLNAHQIELKHISGNHQGGQKNYLKLAQIPTSFIAGLVLQVLPELAAQVAITKSVRYF